ncbi:MAG: DoxX family protein [Mucilaginibacter sp.]
MSVIHRIEYWGDHHHPKILDIIRMMLGVLLIIKGYTFMSNAAYLRDLIIENKSLSQSPDMITAILYYVTYVHLVGGTLIFLGLFTRLSSIFQLPILLGAIFFINDTLAFVNSELWLSILTLGLVVLFAVLGSGPLSLDRFLTDYKAEDEMAE